MPFKSHFKSKKNKKQRERSANVSDNQKLLLGYFIILNVAVKVQCSITN